LKENFFPFFLLEKIFDEKNFSKNLRKKKFLFSSNKSLKIMKKKNLIFFDKKIEQKNPKKFLLKIIIFFLPKIFDSYKKKLQRNFQRKDINFLVLFKQI